MSNRNKKYTTNTENPAPHTGLLLANYIQEKRIRQRALARTLNRSAGVILTYKKNSSIQTAILWELCFALKYNFFQDIADQVPADFAHKTQKNGLESEALASLQARIRDLETENQTLKEVIRMLK